MQTVVTESLNPVSGLADASLHYALCHESPHAVVVADRNGRIIEWNGAAEHLTGISRNAAIQEIVWDVFGRIAPARIPYEVAVSAGRATFNSFLEEAVGNRETAITRPVERRHGLVLSTTGRMYRLTVDFFPLWVGDSPTIAGVVINAELSGDG